ncbi:universal stress protein [Papillibacter cinnamivorans]|uniref:Nucleotide-binding universal stress protein, UspA family n=1 Tax=Papillibacter cinnamivorans DSM 12816 TaxID=1122930 RepID=A0A1W2CYI0_9FIRM|nr:universal stress protein [Papillibacter cinnamivorans]SMC90327.1 Nucleotide-binding universal stress protein, UspA family [Papillibacter cinnamivorans DSM 12816]
MFKKIMVATDGSEYSRHALTQAVEIASCTGGEIKLVFVIDPMPYTWPLAGSPIYMLTDEQIHDIGKKILDGTLRGIDLKQIPVTKKILAGNPSAKILEECGENTDLVVMGTRGHGAFSGALIGSVTHRVAGGAKCPVLIVK